MSMQKYLWILLFLTSACQLNTHPKQDKGTNIFATHFEILNFSDYKVLKIKEAWQGGKDFTYVLSKNNNTPLPDSLQAYPFIKIPLQNIVVTSTTHLPALTMLGVADKLIAFPNTQYVSAPKIRKLIDTHKVKEIGSGMQLNTEALLQLKPDVLMAFSSGQDQRNYEQFAKNGIPVLYNADWMENTPLGRAEWIKVFGLLFDKQTQADSIFNDIADRYLVIKQAISKTQNKPIIFQGGKFGDKWYVPGGNSYAASLIADAGGQYILSNDTHTGSLQMNYENALFNLTKANIWLNPGMVENKQQLLQEFDFASQIKAFKNDKIYTYNLTKGVTGGVLYFEQSNARPDWVLSDLYHIFYPADKDYTFHFYQTLK